MGEIPNSSRIEVYPCNVKSHLQSGSADSITKLANKLLELYFENKIIKLSNENAERFLPYCETLNKDIDGLINELLDNIKIKIEDEEKIEIPITKSKRQFKVQRKSRDKNNWVTNI